MERSKNMKGINKTRPWLAIAALAAATVTGRAVEPQHARFPQVPAPHPRLLSRAHAGVAPSEATGGGGGGEGEEPGRVGQGGAEPGGQAHQRALPEQLQLRHRPEQRHAIRPELPAGHSDHAERGLEPDHADDPADRSTCLRRRPGVRSAFGLGDINPTLFLSPAKPGKFIWGVGPTFTFPTATDPMLGNGKWMRRAGGGGADHAGPLGDRRAGQQPVVLCRLGRQERQRSCSIQPFINYNLHARLVPDHRPDHDRRLEGQPATICGRCPSAAASARS